MPHSATKLAFDKPQQHTTLYNGVDRRVPYTTAETPKTRSSETFMDAHVTLTEALAQVNNLGMLLYQQKLGKEHEQLRNIAFNVDRTRVLIQKGLSIVEFQGKHDRRVSAR